MASLFEYHIWQPVKDPEKLITFLRDIWAGQRDKDDEVEGQDNRFQPFLQFDLRFVRANNYIGFIQHDEQLIEIYPKVFRHLPSPDKNRMLQHIFFWFRYCRKWRFPFNEANLDNREIDEFPELIIHLIARQLNSTLSQQPLLLYQDVQEALSMPRGRINFNRYISQGFSHGNLHRIECDHEPFLFDNKVNRIIKYCTRLLLNQTKFSDNHRLLQEILFMLEEVEDMPATATTVDSVSLNAFFEDYRLALEMCRNIIGQHIYSHSSYDTSHWCMLLPMEYVFEDFVAGFLEKHFSKAWEIHYQKSDAYLVSRPENAFQMQHDIYLIARESKRRIIIDTKYKIRPAALEDKKKGVAQTDLYQVVSYAFRRGCNEIVLVYPNSSEGLQKIECFEVESGFGTKDVIKVKIVEIPFWSMEDMESLEERLKTSFHKILDSQQEP